MRKVAFLIIILFFIFQYAFAINTGKDGVKIKITFNNNVIVAELNDSDTAKDLLAKLPVTLKMNKHQNREFYTNVELDKNGTIQNGYKIGDIGYWTVGNSLVFFYGSGYTDRLIIVGRIVDGIEFLVKSGDSFLARLEVSDGK